MSAPANFGKLTPPPKPIRALQVMQFDCNTWDEVDRRLSEFKEAGVQVVILRVFHNPGDGFYGFIEPRAKTGVYFQTSRLPVVADVLGPVCEMAHKKGLAVYAWMTTRYADYGEESRTDLKCMAWDFTKKRAVPTKGYSPLLPEVHDRIAAVFADLARYPINGVLLQDDLMLRHTEGMNPRAREIYSRNTGKRADPGIFFKKVRGKTIGEYTPEFREWCRWKNSGLIHLAERVRRQVQTVRPKTPVGLNLYYETLTDEKNALSWFAQDLSATINSDLDFYAPMLYHRQMEKELKLSRKATFNLISDSLAEMVGKVDYPQRIWVKVQSIDWNSGARLPSTEVARLIGHAKMQGPVSLVVVPTPKSLDLSMIKESFR